ncbi:Txe/YoeB family addiction module toxin [Verrucomicrobiaceae bacterium R5-34]|uniref:Putative mRNA interferase YoeB n=1 Tax=Oceaniferula flava TaxID=2800421 RepID=A0AAE2SF00_9BACT|nr:Txe/YoeB family addiction module toxin [Oceaniferula flavus]MBK1831893.1 Txe/YoeB family addiction module toxin [Verrucomicrobiaceae bacterium R5-34]MBK1855340.1 Txe/YoeB family addiction module toxin [Oceaniferula flavus]MBM1136646.1 Txe/YoeB family addiction module toxin [Oceaniferula flavus]
MSYSLVYARQARKDAKKLKGTHLAKKAKDLLEVIKENPYADPPPYESLVGDLKGAYSRRINIQHRLVYEVVEDEHVIKVLRLWTHYE